MVLAYFLCHCKTIILTFYRSFDKVLVISEGANFEDQKFCFHPFRRVHPRHVDAKDINGD
jgi:hypothetical protein